MAQKSQQTGTSRAIGDTKVVDTDIHINRGMPIKEIASYLDEPYKSHMLKPSIFPLPVSGWNRGLGGKIEGGSLSGPEDIQKSLCDEFGVDYPILNTTSWLPRLPQSDLAVALMRAYNDLLLDKFLDSYDHFRGLVTIATQKPDKAAEEIDRLGDEDQIVGIYIATTGSMAPVGDERYNVIYEAAQDNDLTITYHASGGAFQFDFNRQNQALEKFFSIHTLAHPWGQMLTLVSLMENGIWEKFPDLDFMFLESGLLWVPYMMYRMNREYSMRRSELPLLKKSPEEYIRERATFSTQPVGEPNNSEHMVQAIKMLGADNIAFSTDYPHWDFDSPEGVEKYIRQADDDVREKILGKNASEIYGIDLYE